MKAGPSILLVLAIAAGCRNSDRGERAGSPKKSDPVHDEPAVADIPGLDLGELEPTIRNDAIRVLNDTYCYCGCPRTVASCLANRNDCSCTNCSERMARFIMNEYKQGSSTEDVEAQLLGGFSEGFNGPQRAFDGREQPAKGGSGAAYVIAEFADFKCPHCAGAFDILNDLVAKRSDVRIEYFYFPLSGNGESSVRAAEAAEEARRQGKFWEMAKELFEGQFDLSEANVNEYAKKVGLDMDAFSKALADRTHRDKVFANKKLGESVGVESTPALFLNGRSFGLARTLENLEMRIEMEAERGTCN